MKKILILLLLLFTGFLVSQEIAIFTKTQGEIITEQNSVKIFSQTGDVINNNSTISTAADSYALINYKFTNGALKVFPNSVVNIMNVDNLSTKVTLASGKILNDLKEKVKGSYTVETNSTVASVRGTAFEVVINEEGTDIMVVEGKVDVKNKVSGRTHSLNANQRLISKNNGELVELTLEGKPIPEVEKPQKSDGDQSSNTSKANFSIPTTPPLTFTSGTTNTSSAKPKAKKDEKGAAKTDSKVKETPKDNKSTSFPIAVVLKAKGELILLRGGKESKCPVGTLLEDKDIIKTDNNSLGLIKFVDDSSQIRLFSNSQVVINVEANDKILNKNLKLDGGSILSSVNNKIVGKYSVSTTSTIASVRGTEFLVELENGITKVTGFSGRVEVENQKSKEKIFVTKGNTLTSGEDGKMDRKKTETVSPEVQEELDSTKYDNTMQIQFENEDGSIKTIILEY